MSNSNKILQIEKNWLHFGWFGCVYLKREICLASETSLPVIKKGGVGKKPWCTRFDHGLKPEKEAVEMV